MPFREPKRAERMIDYLAAREAAIDRKVAAMDRALELRILARLAAKAQGR